MPLALFFQDHFGYSRLRSKLYDQITKDLMSTGSEAYEKCLTSLILEEMQLKPLLIIFSTHQIFHNIRM